jgi:hypothetical protein
MKVLLLSLLSVSAVLQGCANSSGARMGLFSATAPVHAILADDVFRGQAVGYASGSGTIRMWSVLREDVSCVGEFEYSGMKSGSGQVRCNDGVTALFNFHALSTLSGYGFGNSNAGPFSFTFGLTAEQSVPYLKVPERKKLERDGETLKLAEDEAST